MPKLICSVNRGACIVLVHYALMTHKHKLISSHVIGPWILYKLNTDNIKEKILMHDKTNSIPTFCQSMFAYMYLYCKLFIADINSDLFYYI